MTSCDSKMNNMVNLESDFNSRIHTTDIETDLFKLLGKTTYEKHLKDFENIDWEKEYWKENRSNHFNVPDLEVLDNVTSKYFTISVCPNTQESFQYYVGFGNHNLNNETGKVTRVIKIYGTSSTNQERIKELIKLFFEKDYKKLQEKLDNLDFFEELDDAYENIETK